MTAPEPPAESPGEKPRSPAQPDGSGTAGAVEALGFFGRALDEETRGEAAALARAGLRRVGARLGRDVEFLRGCIAEAEALSAGSMRAAWLATAASVNRYRLGAVERATTTVELALADEPADLALLATAAEDHLAAGRWRRAVELLDRQADLVGDPDYMAVLQAQAAHVAEQQIGDDEGRGAACVGCWRPVRRIRWRWRRWNESRRGAAMSPCRSSCCRRRWGAPRIPGSVPPWPSGWRS